MPSLTDLVACLTVFSLLHTAHSAPNFDDALARRMMDFSAAAYAPNPDGCFSSPLLRDGQWKRSGYFNDKCDFLDNTCSAYVAISDRRKELVVVFRGTTAPGQLLLEGYSGVRPGTAFYNYGSVQSYFKNSLDKIWPSISGPLKDAKYKAYTVYFTGHSLGGALASLAALQTVHQGLKPAGQVKLVTFGQPRTGDAAFASGFDQKIPYAFRVINAADIVPHLPMCKKGSNGCDKSHTNTPYHHGTEIWYPSGMQSGAKFSTCRGAPTNEDRGCSDGIKNILYSEQNHVYYFNHHVSSYGKDGCKDNGPNMPKPSVGAKVEEARSKLVSTLSGARATFSKLTGKK